MGIRRAQCALLVALAIVGCRGAMKPEVAKGLVHQTPAPLIASAASDADARRDAAAIAIAPRTFDVVFEPTELGENQVPSVCAIDNKVFVCGLDRLLVVQDGEVVESEPLARGLPRKDGKLTQEVASVFGSWPSGAFLFFARYPNVRGERLYRWSADRWVPFDWPRPLAGQTLSWTIVAVGEVVLGFVFSPQSKGRFDLLAGPKGTVLPDVLDGPRGPNCHGRIDPMTARFAALPSGEIFMAGEDCADGASIAVVRWQLGRAAGTVLASPPPRRGAPANVSSLATVRGHLVAVGGYTFPGDAGRTFEVALWTLDDGNWLPIEPPFELGARGDRDELVLGEDGSAWWLSHAAWWLPDPVLKLRRAGGAEWVDIALPPGITGPRGLHVTPRDGVWLEAMRDGHTVLLRSRSR
jgi:hypothetical protein